MLTGTLPWYVARASGLLAWAMLSGSVALGLLLATRLLGPTPRPQVLLRLHRKLATLSLVFVGIHLAAIWVDSYVHFTLLALLVPFASRWHPVAVAWGVAALYLLAAVAVTSLGFRRLPARARQLWRPVHLSTHVLFALATVHLLTAGTDARNPVLRPAVAAVTAGIGMLALLGVGGRPSGADRGRRAAILAARSAPPRARSSADRAGAF